MSSQPESFVAQALAARAHIVSAIAEIRAFLDDCDEEEAASWQLQLTELAHALRLIDEQVAEHSTPPTHLHDDRA